MDDQLISIFIFLLELLLLPFLIIVVICDKIIDYFVPNRENYDNPSMPILLIHGSGAHKSEWTIGKTYLSASFLNIYDVSYDKYFSTFITVMPGKTIEEYTLKIREKVQEICKNRKNKTIILIGHSMGGIIAGYYTENFAKIDGIEVKHVVSIASPWHGSALIDYLPFINRKMMQLKQRSGFLDRLRKQINGNKTTKYFNISSEHDLLVSGNSGLMQNKTVYKTRFLGHYSIIMSGNIWRKILQKIKE